MNETLLKIFNETLDEETKRMKSVQGVIERHQFEIEEKQEELKSVEGQLKCAIYEETQATKRVSVLGEYLRGVGKPPHVLLNKAKNLGDEQERVIQARRVVEERVENVRRNLQSKTTRLAVLEEEYVGIRKGWNEVSGVISQEHTNM